MFNWFKFMLSIPREKPLTKTERFTQWSCLLAYVIGGVSILFAPQLWAMILRLPELQGRSEGYLRLVGLGVFEIGFILLIAARSNHKMSQHQECLTSVVGRLLFVDSIITMMILRGMLPLSIALFFMVLDSFLALITLVLWCRESNRASIVSFFREISTPLLQPRKPLTAGSTLVIYLLGIVQLFFWLVFVVRPDFAQRMFHLEAFQGYSGGYLACYLFLTSLHGLYHVVGASNVNHCLSLAFISYRVLINMPVFVILFLVEQIERNIFVVLMSFDVFYSVVIAIPVWQEKRFQPNSESEVIEI
ncbi:uncharacterized protein LOC111328566 [Stylophora pistillata]|nr:uncharacterized protein LOC111328566 [Stylophora pistillata]XP_022788764.1 uncharacterized protein LOC111328566 [Stylophora pistillata]